MTQPTASTTSTRAVPAHYAAQDLEKVRSVEQWLRENGQSRSWLARKLRTSSSTISQVLNSKYPSPPTALLDQMLATLQVEAARHADGTPGYVEGSVHKLAFVVCDRTRKHANFGVMTGHVGVGKTRSLREYAQRQPQTILIEANPQMTPGSLLIELLEKLGVPLPHGLDKKFQTIVKALAGTNYLLLVDEAENMSGQALHYLRRIRDKANVGVVLCGTPKLHALIKPEHGQFDQIRSRVSMWPATVQGITRDDADDMAREALRDAPVAEGASAEVPDEVLDALWAYGAGSARVLVESLVPALRDYGYGRQALSGALVDKIATKVLFMAPRRAA